ncbi:MAG: transporter [Clostridiales bacterium GWC2_40_7]|nr:MAG: transporter [Clostridiales bacterium GWC2_40_7]
MNILTIHKPRALFTYIKYLVIMIVAIIFASPLYISFIFSMKTQSDMGTRSPLALPESLYLGNYIDVITRNKAFQIGLVNSVLTTIPIVILLTVLCSMAAYVLARNNKKVHSFIYYIFLAGILIPFQCIMFPTYVNLKSIGLMNTLIGFVIVRTGFQIAICILILTNFIKTVPLEVEEAANIDGASHFQTFWQVVFPLMKPINVTMIILNTLFAWNDFYVSLTILQQNAKRTLPLAQFVYISEAGVDINTAFAFFTLCMLPVLILYLFAQKYIVSGIMSGAVKG